MNSQHLAISAPVSRGNQINQHEQMRQDMGQQRGPEVGQQRRQEMIPELRPDVGPETRSEVRNGARMQGNERHVQSDARDLRAQGMIRSERRQERTEREISERENPSVTIAKENIDASVKQVLIAKRNNVKNKASSIFGENYSQQLVELATLREKLSEFSDEKLDLEPLHQYLNAIAEQYQELSPQEFQQLQKYYDKIFQQQTLIVPEEFQSLLGKFEILSLLHQDMKNLKQLTTALIKKEEQKYFDVILVEVTRGIDPTITPKEEFGEAELKRSLQHLNQYYKYKSYPNSQEKGAFIILNPEDFKKIPDYNMKELLVISPSQNDPGEQISYGLLQVKGQGGQRIGKSFSLPKMKPQLQNQSKELNCTQFQPTILQQFGIKDLIMKFFTLTLVEDAFKSLNYESIIKKITDYMISITRQEGKVDVFELERIGFRL